MTGNGARKVGSIVTLRHKTPIWIILVHLAALAPAALLGVAVARTGLGPDPIGAATRRTGRYALVMLLVALTPTPLARLAGVRQVLRIRRPVGLYAFGYAALHLAIYVGWDYGFALRYALEAISRSPFIWAGAASLLILSVLAATSARGLQRRLGRSWKTLHRLVYLAGALAGLHYAWVFKELRLLPVAYFGLLTLLLVPRIPAVRRRLVALTRSAKP